MPISPETAAWVAERTIEHLRAGKLLPEQVAYDCGGMPVVDPLRKLITPDDKPLILRLLDDKHWWNRYLGTNASRPILDSEIVDSVRAKWHREPHFHTQLAMLYLLFHAGGFSEAEAQEAIGRLDEKKDFIENIRKFYEGHRGGVWNGLCERLGDPKFAGARPIYLLSLAKLAECYPHEVGDLPAEIKELAKSEAALLKLLAMRAEQAWRDACAARPSNAMRYWVAKQVVRAVRNHEPLAEQLVSTIREPQYLELFEDLLTTSDDEHIKWLLEPQQEPWHRFLGVMLASKLLEKLSAEKRKGLGEFIWRIWKTENHNLTKLGMAHLLLLVDEGERRSEIIAHLEEDAERARFLAAILEFFEGFPRGPWEAVCLRFESLPSKDAKELKAKELVAPLYLLAFLALAKAEPTYAGRTPNLESLKDSRDGLVRKLVGALTRELEAKKGNQ